jgi:hypothetical protein
MDRLLNPQPERLKGSKYDNDGDLSAFSQKFDEGVKRAFSNYQAPQHVRFGSPRDNDPEYGIKAGRLTLTGLTLTYPVGKFASKLSSIQLRSCWVL